MNKGYSLVGMSLPTMAGADNDHPLGFGEGTVQLLCIWHHMPMHTELPEMSA